MNTNKYFHQAALAGAGTGKTYSLVENYLMALFGFDDSREKKRPHQILALTFTQKAAGEMRVRVVTRLGQFLDQESATKDPLASFAHEHSLKLPKPDEIKRLMRALPNAAIQTFHGFCHNLLREESRALGLRDNFDILEPGEELKLARMVLRPIILKKITDQDVIIQSLTARFRLGRGLLSMGLLDGVIDLYFKIREAGLGFDRYSHTKIDSHDVAKLEASYDKIDHALRDFLNNNNNNNKTKSRLANISRSIHALRAWLSDKSESKLADIYLILREDTKGVFGKSDKRQALVAAIDEFFARAVDYYVAYDEVAVANILEQFHEQFSRVKKEANSYSYADLLNLARDGLRDNVDVRSRVKQRFMHVLVDEYQDTSGIQEQLIAMICENKKISKKFDTKSDLLSQVDLSHGASLFVVGDKKQSIYGFRGARVELFDRMIDKMAMTHGADGSFVKRQLSINRRSEANILAFANLVSRHGLSDQGYREEDDLLPYVSTDSGDIELWQGQCELKCAALGIKKLLQDNLSIRPTDITILVRRIKSASKLKEYLADYHISSRIVGGEGFFQSQEVVDLIATLKLINDPSHVFASMVVLRSPLILMPDRFILNFSNDDNPQGAISFSNAQSLAEKNIFPKDLSHRVIKLAKTLQKIKTTIHTHGLSFGVDELIHNSKLAYALGLEDNADQKWANIKKLRNLFIGMNKNPNLVIDEYFDHIFKNNREPQAADDAGADQVSIMTIHQSKGLEFNTVVLADIESSLPNMSQEFCFDDELGLAIKAKGRAIERCVKKSPYFNTRFNLMREKRSLAEHKEMARILYVALTRAKERIYIACSNNGYSAGASSRSLLGMILKSYNHSEHKFLSLCKIRELSDDNTKLSDTAKTHQDLARYTRLPDTSAQVSYQRIFSSALKASPNLPSFFASDHRFGQVITMINGDKAHKIIASAGEMLASSTDTNANLISRYVDASFRAHGFEEEKKLKKACEKTLLMLQGKFHNAIDIIFEKPLVSRPSENLIIEGFADLVCNYEAYVGVIEFKSSKRLVRHPDTYLQVMAYAHALEQAYKKPTKCAVLLVGTDCELRWQDFDSRLKESYLKEINGQA